MYGATAGSKDDINKQVGVMGGGIVLSRGLRLASVRKDIGVVGAFDEEAGKVTEQQ